MQQTMINELINTMRERIPRGNNLANYLMETLCISKEAVYRRLRNEVAFTFNEIATISKELHISLDQIIGNSFPDGAIFDLKLLQSPDPLENYYDILDRYVKLFRYVKNDPHAEISTASNIIPYTLYSSYEYLSKYRICRWMYQIDKMSIPSHLSNMYVPDKLAKIHKTLNEEVKQMPKTCFIWDEHIFSSFVKEIKYFAELNLISESDVANLKKELHQLLNNLENMAIKGKFDNGNNLSIYLSNISFEATYTFIEKNEFQICLFRIYSINSIDSQDPKICNAQKKWIQSMKRHSTLISQSNEMQRIMFFNEQRKVINTL
ncbi:MAG: hypothetical protein PUB21_05125 [Bacteroidales bacterium]|nr:hypothetical protein [Bacteroidales bacterium]